ncbi:MAG TPA: spermidine synthase [Methylomirabilota bacterium]|nr:spermidine synthase [Methylomirabilota bacterium]
MAQEPSVFWYRESGTPYEYHSFAARSFLFTGRTAFQEVAILDTQEYGKMLVIDGRTQSAEEDEYIYHEALVHPAMLTHPAPRQVLIIGGGEGASLREVLRYRTVERVVMVDIDRELVELCQKWLPEWHQGAFQDPRVELVFADGKDYIEHTSTTFDVVIVDICDALEEGPALALYTESFYRGVQRRLAAGGLLVVQAMELSGLDYVDHVQVRDTLSLVFQVVRSYVTFIPSFWADWGFLIASNSLDPAGVAPDLLMDRLRTRGATGVENLAPQLDFYDPDAHVRMFALSKDVKARLNHQTLPRDTPPARAQ